MVIPRAKCIQVVGRVLSRTRCEEVPRIALVMHDGLDIHAHVVLGGREPGEIGDCRISESYESVKSSPSPCLLTLSAPLM